MHIYAVIAFVMLTVAQGKPYFCICFWFYLNIYTHIYIYIFQHACRNCALLSDPSAVRGFAGGT